MKAEWKRIDNVVVNEMGMYNVAFVITYHKYFLWRD